MATKIHRRSSSAANNQTNQAVNAAIKATASDVAKPSYGVMVAPDRYVNLAPGARSLSKRIMARIQSAMLLANFRSCTLRDKRLLLVAILRAKNLRKHPHQSYRGKKVTRQSFGARRPNNRNQEQIRMYLLGMIWYVWIKGAGSDPEVNGRRNPDMPFVVFVKALAPWFSLGNVVKNLERYQSYRKATMAGGDYRSWRQKVAH